MDRIEVKKVIENYANIDNIWSDNDKWHFYTYKKINAFINRHVRALNLLDKNRVINLGSGGNSYCFDDETVLHVDILDKNIKNKKHFLVSNIEHMNVPSDFYDIGICVGSVINYTDAMTSIKEIARIIKTDGLLFLEFENSRSFEFLGSNTYNKKASVVTTFYQNRKEMLWVYSEAYIMALLKMYGFRIINKHRFHIFTPLLYRIAKDSDIAMKVYWMDKIFHFLPLSSNVLVLAKKE